MSKSVAAYIQGSNIDAPTKVLLINIVQALQADIANLQTDVASLYVTANAAGADIASLYTAVGAINTNIDADAGTIGTDYVANCSPTAKTVAAVTATTSSTAESAQ